MIEGGKPKIVGCKILEEIPESIRRDPDLKDLVRGRLKSWSDYTKKERKLTIDKLISEMHQTNVNTKGFQRILEGMDKVWQ
jgi:hypothetical protein